ncbi:hypothetical protein P691DRAFT_766328 [Macrolepiota fuliginosa MF-IS2]|uniref:Uncharacterized protein n=1 Tax=Macrolepiota fuliginosa MF-IS2 TaxID=1400762 RepID=A0A9P5WYV1_9AGAR|nr:hypothetical protein P691DRAFT_766328 [Macrolepiota fuliginosa MF-IS2]
MSASSEIIHGLRSGTYLISYISYFNRAIDSIDTGYKSVRTMLKHPQPEDALAHSYQVKFLKADIRRIQTEAEGNTKFVKILIKALLDFDDGPSILISNETYRRLMELAGLADRTSIDWRANSKLAENFKALNIVLGLATCPLQQPSNIDYTLMQEAMWTYAMAMLFFQDELCALTREMMIWVRYCCVETDEGARGALATQFKDRVRPALQNLLDNMEARLPNSALRQPETRPPPKSKGSLSKCAYGLAVRFRALLLVARIRAGFSNPHRQPRHDNEAQ